jgi:hypothetical protein
VVVVDALVDCADATEASIGTAGGREDERRRTVRTYQSSKSPQLAAVCQEIAMKEKKQNCKICQYQ